MAIPPIILGANSANYLRFCGGDRLGGKLYAMIFVSIPAFFRSAGYQIQLCGEAGIQKIRTNAIHQAGAMFPSTGPELVNPGPRGEVTSRNHVPVPKDKANGLGGFKKSAFGRT